MICRIFSSKAFKLGDVKRELGRHSRPTSVMVYRVMINWLKSRRLTSTIYGSKGATGIVIVVVPLVVFPALRMGLPPSLGPEPDMVKVTRGEPGVEGEPNKPEEESECELGRGLTRILCGGVSIPIGN